MMTIESTPLLFPQVLGTQHLDPLTRAHDLTQADLDWLHHVALPSHAQRRAQTRPMWVETITLQAGDNPPIPLAGCFTLSALPYTGQADTDEADLRPAFLYTPYGGLKKFANLQALDNRLDELLDDSTARADLFRFLAISQRAELNAASSLEKSRRTITNDVFRCAIDSIEHAQNLNALVMVDELLKLPSLRVMLEEMLSEAVVNFDHQQTRVALSTGANPADPQSGQVTRHLSLAEAVLVYFHHQGRPVGHDVDFIHPQITASSENTRQWESVLKGTARNLIPSLIRCIDRYWDASGPFHASRRLLLSQVIESALQASILHQRDSKQLTDEQNQELLRLFRPSRREEPLLFIESVRLWEYEPLYVELAGALMISGKGHYLYTPNRGVQKVDNYLGFKDVLLNKPTPAAGKEALYSLLSLDERNRFLRFDTPQVSGKAVDLPVSESLAGAIIGKQLNNLSYALQMSRQNEMDIHALIDKALDIRSLIGPSLMRMETDGHWGTQPAFYGDLRPSNYLADTLERKIKSYATVEDALNSQLTRLPATHSASLRTQLRGLLPNLAHVFSLGLRAEAELRELNETLPAAAHDLISSVFAADSQYPDRKQRIGVKGFRPDVYSLRVAYHAEGEMASMPLASCFFLTERGGLDTPLSGMGILWTPADGLQAFSCVEFATKHLNRQLLDPQRRFALLANLTPSQRKPHGRYQFETFELIEDNAPLNRMQSFIEHFEAEHSYLNALKAGDWRLTGTALRNSLQARLNAGAPTNLPRAVRIAEAIRWQQKLPAWLGTASVEDQRLHIDLLEQYKNSASDGKDYLDGIEPLHSYVNRTLKRLLNTRFAASNLDPATLLITPNLAVAGPASLLTDFALNHNDVIQMTGFKVSSTTRQKLPDGLNEAAIRQLLLSLDIPTVYQRTVVDTLSGSGVEARQSKQRFGRQLPWQLLQYAHALHLQQHLSPTAFDLIRQVLDMPDAIARQAVAGASALIRPLELIKTEGTRAIKTLGLYLIGSSSDATAPQVLYSPYHTGHQFSEFKDEASVLAAFNVPGALQDLLIRRLPESQQATFANLFASTVGASSEIALASNPITTNLLDTLFNDNVRLLADMLTTQSDTRRHFDWDTVKHLFKAGVKLAGKQLQGKLTFIETLWESYQDFKASAESLQQHDWKAGLHDFIAGAAEMVSLGALNPDDTFGLLAPIGPGAPGTPGPSAPSWKDIASTVATRTNLHPFEANGVSLDTLHKHATHGTYKDMATGKLYVPVAGKVFQVAKVEQAWRVIHANAEGPILHSSPDGQHWTIDPRRQTIRYGKVMSTLSNAYSDHTAAGSMNIEARGMAQIRRKYPHYATAIVQALETARHYCGNALHNLDQIKRQVPPGSRLEVFLKAFFGVHEVDASLVKKIHTAVAPICQALADPSWELQNGKRIVIGNLKDANDAATAFVLEPNAVGRIYLTQFFFHVGLDEYKELVPPFFNIDAHAQAATLIHEISHQLFNTYDIAYLDAALPFLDLISRATPLGKEKYNSQKKQQSSALSLSTPRHKLFMAWDGTAGALRSLERVPELQDVAREILKVTGAESMDEARDVFLYPHLPDKRIDLILRNADSLTRLICELGRQLDAPSSLPMR
ncbi:dermonecrotic toxin domain-containing protein [Pseudomonas sp. SMV71]|uniref:dermonecrotic toxin domain-containing protein n=1 Tax=Pseudomonas sp. SMV71 TaxID=3390195 RepID=UPI003F867666